MRMGQMAGRKGIRPGFRWEAYDRRVDPEVYHLSEPQVQGVQLEERLPGVHPLDPSRLASFGVCAVRLNTRPRSRIRWDPVVLSLVRKFPLLDRKRAGQGSEQMFCFVDDLLRHWIGDVLFEDLVDDLEDVGVGRVAEAMEGMPKDFGCRLQRALSQGVDERERFFP